MQHLNEVKPRFVVNEAVEQIAYADRIIVNKVELDFVIQGSRLLLYFIQPESPVVTFISNLTIVCSYLDVFFLFQLILADWSGDRGWVGVFGEEN